MFIDIEHALSIQAFYSGTKLRGLPKGGKDLRRCNRGRLSTRTLFNLQYFTSNYGVEWYDYQIYDVEHTWRPRTGYIIYGKIDYQPDFISYITYGRIETTGVCAGATKIWILHGLPLQKSFLQDSFDPTFKNYEYPYNMWVELVTPFVEKRDATK